MRQLAHPEVVDDEERNGGQLREVGFTGARERRVGEPFKERVFALRREMYNPEPDRGLPTASPWPRTENRRSRSLRR